MSSLPTVHEIAKTIDHALLKPTLTQQELETGLALAAKYDVFSVCVRPADIKFAVGYLETTDVQVGTVIGFPHGVNHTETKVFETTQAAKDGATEVDMVLNIGWVKSGRWDEVCEEIRRIVETASVNDIEIVKVIFETAYLTEDEIARASKVTEEAGADFVKTSTGFAGEGATVPNLQIMRNNVSSEIEVKASGGVTDLETLLAMRELGVTRFGTSATKNILDELAARLAGIDSSTEKYTEKY